MKLFFKYILFLIPFITFAQQKDSLNVKEYHPGQLLIEAGINQNIALGDNFLNDSYKLGLGTEVGIDVFITSNWLLGIYFEGIHTQLKKPENVGSIKSTNIFSASINGGYNYKITPKFDIGGRLIAGYASYNHLSTFDTNFHDKAFLLGVQGKAAYNFNKNIGMYGQIKLRNDFLSIKTSPDLKDYFNNAIIMNLGLGIRITTN